MKERKRAPGGGRKFLSENEPTVRRVCSMPASYAEFLRTIHPSQSEAIRILIKRAMAAKE